MEFGQFPVVLALLSRQLFIRRLKNTLLQPTDYMGLNELKKAFKSADELEVEKIYA